MTFRLALAQSKYPEDGDVAAMVERYARRAAEQRADLLAFPEALMTRYNGSLKAFCEAAEPVDGPFAQAVAASAARHGLWIAFTMNELNPDETNLDVPDPGATNLGNPDTGKPDPGASNPNDPDAGVPDTGKTDPGETNLDALPFNTLVLVDDTGKRRARYRKVHLFDAQGERESDRMSAGDELANSVKTPFATVGLAICYDLRFPEVALHAALSGAHIMLYPAAWVDGPGKVHQWETLLAARAIENGMFVAGIGSSDPGRIGRSCVFGPDGTMIASGPEREDKLVVCDIDLSEIDRVRSATPSLQHRRPDCYR